MRLYIGDIEGVSSERLADMMDGLPAWRRKKALAYKREQGRIECAASYMLLCRALKETYGIGWQPDFVIGEHGKPVLAMPEGTSCLAGRSDDASCSAAQSEPISSDLNLPHFNMSHCKKAVACVVADSEVGVDIERVGRLSDAVARYVLNDDEYAEVMAADDPDLVFTVFWTKKEAIVKLTGRGIDDDLKNIIVNNEHVKLHTELHADKGYVVTVASYQVL